MGIRISKDHLHPSVIESITSLIGDLDQLETTAKGNAVEAINELLANGGNKEELEALIAEIAEGKELIANAVGEPLTAEESFDEMSNDINSLLSTFKTNMMNNGITVESGDKFKSLIDKITTMVEEGEGKGMQFASHVYSTTFGEFPTAYHTGHTGTLTINTNLNFTPTYVFCKIYAYAYDSYQHDTINATISNIAALSCSEYTIEIKNITPESFDVVYPKEVSSTEHTEVYVREWYAIGVGEEDTTLRDSLASILENKGVDVTEEDDMASLITKVDSIEIGSIRYEGTHTLTSTTVYPSTSYTVDTGATKNIQEVWVITTSADSYGRSAARIMVDSRLNYSVDTMLKPFSDVDTIGYYISNISGSTFNLNIVDTNNYGVRSYSFKWYAFT